MSVSSPRGNGVFCFDALCVEESRLEHKSDSDHKWLEKEMEKWHISARTDFCLHLAILRPILSGTDGEEKQNVPVV